MLDPRDRSLLLDSLRPPVGYQLDEAIGTSYTLDLLALLTAPLAFTFFDWEDDDGKPTTNPLALLEAVRRHSEQIHLFCQAGAIKLPPAGRPLLAYLEKSVVEVQSPHSGGVFHPKVWLLRYLPSDETESVRYRLLCLSRNLTFDRSWDTVLVLDGVLTERQRAFARNHPLGNFVRALPELAVQPVSEKLTKTITRFEREVRRVAFEVPEGFDSSRLAFHAIGLSDEQVWPFPTNRRPLLVVSPFVSSNLLEKLAADRSHVTVVSRVESLSDLHQPLLEKFDDVYVLATEAEPEHEDLDSGEGTEGPDLPEDDGLHGLHAKLYVIDDGWNARVFTGSANATDAAFARNVELLVELRGKKKRCGIDTVLGDEQEESGGIRKLLKPWVPETVPPDPRALLRRELERTLGRLRRRLAGARLEAHYEMTDDKQTYRLAVRRKGRAPRLPKGATLRGWPVSFKPDLGVPLDISAAVVCEFGPLSFEALTSFFAIEIALSKEDVGVRQRFVFNLPIEGVPTDRNERLLHSLLRDRDQVLRLLWMLLSQEEIAVQDLVDIGAGGRGGEWRATGFDGVPLLEAMLEALERSPRSLDDVERLVKDLSRTSEGRALLPEGFEEIFGPVQAVSRSLTK